MSTDTRTEKEKMLAGELYNALEPQLISEREVAREFMYDYNLTRPSEGKKRDEILRKLFAKFGTNSVIETPLRCDYGCDAHWGDNSFANHPIDPQQRLTGLEYGKPIRIGDNVWIDGGSIVVAGVTIGDNSVIGAGSVVVKDSPANVVTVGNPCRVIKQLDAPTRPPQQFQQITTLAQDS